MGTRLARSASFVASPLLVGAGGVAWAVITRQLKAQKIEVHPDSLKLGGKLVAGPLTAFSQAAVIESTPWGWVMDARSPRSAKNGCRRPGTATRPGRRNWQGRDRWSCRPTSYVHHFSRRYWPTEFRP